MPLCRGFRSVAAPRSSPCSFSTPRFGTRSSKRCTSLTRYSPEFRCAVLCDWLWRPLCGRAVCDNDVGVEPRQNGVEVPLETRLWGNYLRRFPDMPVEYALAARLAVVGMCPVLIAWLVDALPQHNRRQHEHGNDAVVPAQHTGPQVASTLPSERAAHRHLAGACQPRLFRVRPCRVLSA